MTEPRNARSIGELSRKIFINDERKNRPFKYPRNQIQTRKYTILTFLPKSLFIQFLRLANVYFLISAILSSIDEVSSVGPVTSIVPLAFVLITSIVREAFEDWKRYKNDKSINNQKVDVYHVNGKNAKAFAPKLWKKIAVGEFVRIKNNEEIPADMILLTSSEEHGLAYVETANLDGERNLKLKQPNSDIKELVDKVGVGELKGVMLVESPNKRIHHFKGIIEIEGLEAIYLTYNNLLIRGTHLKNTDYAIGLVVYTGHDSKLLRNQGQFRNKRSSIERQLNKYIVFIFIVQILLCLLLTILHVFFKDSYVDVFKGPSLTYLFSSQSIKNETEGKSTAVEALITFASFLLLLNTMIPISLMVSLEVTKWFQSTWLEFDVLMWEGQQKSKVLNMLIHEDLGRVDYIFADKTGTLTSNEMRFKYCSIDGVIFSKQQLIDGIAQPVKDEDQLKGDNKYKKFWLTVGMCHDIVINHKAEDQDDPRARYQGSSPDEVELVSMASEVNYTFKEKRVDIYTLDIDGRLRDFQILVKIDFSSDRKRMSIIARELETHKIYLFCKGADSIILQRIRKETPDRLLQHTDEDLQAFSKEGLRTLVIAYKEIEEEMFMEWYERYQNHNKEQYNVSDEEKHAADLAILEDEMEKDLVLLGVTALEDKLQEGVAETIRDLHKAGIKIWMLTGDKMETAENIGHATNLIAYNTLVFRIKTGDPDKTMEEYQQIESQINKITKKSLLLPLPSLEEDTLETSLSFQYTSFALIIDGEAISCTFSNPRLKGLFIHLIPHFRTVICCRSTPSQKADVVTFVKTNLKKLTLAIGDGGNDVNMIQKADIGVGIFGKEGNQAAFASDYAFVKFFFLWRLLLVHGRWFYLRTSNFINFFFYKNLIFTLPQFWFALYSGYSGQSIYDDSFITTYNAVFTSVAPVCYAAQEQDINPRETETIKKTLPYVYEEFRDKIKLFGPKKFTYWWALGFAHSLIVFYVTKATYTEAVDSKGFTFDLWEQSVSAFAGVLCTVFTILVIGTNWYNVVTFICYGIFTFLLYFPIGSVIMDHVSTYVNDVLGNVLGTPKFWLCLFLIVVACSYLVYIPKQYFSFFQPNLADLLQRDRNQKWKNMSKEARKEIMKRNYVLKYDSEEPFDFNKRIMLRSWWYNPQPTAEEGRNE